MNQALACEFTQVMPQVIATGVLSSLVTFQQRDGTLSPSGAPNNNYVNVSGLVNIPCGDAPPSTLRIQATEVKELSEILSKGLRHLLLNGYYPQATPDGQIPTGWRAVVDGISYDILGVEHDSQETQTRLDLQVVLT